MKKLYILLLSLCMVFVIGGCGSKKDEGIVSYFDSLKTVESSNEVNAMTSSYEDMVEYLESKGYIDKGASAIDINTTEGYVIDNTGGSFSVAAVADKAYDYDGLWLLWWNLEDKSDFYETYVSLKNNGVVVINAGEAILETAGANGSYAIAFGENYTKNDEALAEFGKINNEANSLPYLSSALDLAKLFKAEGYIADITKYEDLEENKEVDGSFAEASWKYDDVTIFYLGSTPSGAAYANYLALEEGGDTITAYKYKEGSYARWYSKGKPDLKDGLEATENTYHVDAYFGGFAMSVNKSK